MNELATVRVRVSDFERCNADLDRLEDENERLKALVHDMFKALTTLDVDYCQACPRDTANGPCTAYVRAYDGCSFAVDMRDLGIEVKA